MNPLSNLALPLAVALAAAQLNACPSTETPTPVPDGDPGADCTSTFLVEEVNAASQPGYPDPYLAVSCTTDTVNVMSNGIPSFSYTQVTPNALREQDFQWSFPRNPAVAASTTAIWMTGPTGVAVNGLPLYAPNEAPNDGYGDPVADGLLDFCQGHTDQSGSYHFHARPDCLFEEVDGQVHLVIGYAFDGIPLVAPFECTDAGCTATREVKSSYVYVGGSENAYEANVYRAGSGDLDACNGKTGSDGVYRYYATDTFPYTFACFRGTPETSNNPTAGGGGPQDPGTTDGCTSDAQCTGACPAGSVGCVCSDRPDGSSGCAPSCTKDSDCPAGQGGTLTCDENVGICVPPGGP